MTAPEIPVTITGWGPRATGRASIDSRSVFIPFTLPGETALVRMIDTGIGRPRASLVKILNPSPDRIDPGCSQAMRCPGCQLRHCDYATQLRWLRKSASRTLARIEGLEQVLTDSVTPHAVTNGYRVRCRAAVLSVHGRPVAGMHPNANGLAPIDLSACSNHDPAIGLILGELMAVLASSNFVGSAAWPFHAMDIALSVDGAHRMILMTADPVSFLESGIPDRIRQLLPGLALLVLKSAPDNPAPALHRAMPIDGKPEIFFPASGLRLAASPGAWTPVAHGSADQLARIVLTAVDSMKGKLVVEFGCGIGCLTFPLALSGIDVIGIDSSLSAIESARGNARRQRLDRLQFLNGTARHHVRRLAARHTRPGTLIFHGMRRPFGPDVMACVGVLDAKQLILISPAIAALAADLIILAQTGWRCESIRLLDQIPHTTGVLGIACCYRQ